MSTIRHLTFIIHFYNSYLKSNCLGETDNGVAVTLLLNHRVYIYICNLFVDIIYIISPTISFLSQGNKFHPYILQIKK